MSATNYNKTGVLIRNNTIYLQGMVDGKFIRKSTRKKATKANIKWAENNAHDVLLQLTQKTVEQKIVYTIEEFGLKSFAMNKAKRRDQTNRRYKNMFYKNIVPYFQNKKLTDLKVSDLKLWQTKLFEQGLDPKTIKNNRSVFNYILKDALSDELITKDLFKFVDVIPLKDPEIYPFSLEEMKTLLNESSGWFHNYLKVAFLTGMRTGEMIGLRWDDVQFNEEIISIKQAISEGVIGEPKTKAGIREIEMLPDVKKALQSQYKLTGHKKTGYVFLTQHDKYYKKSDSIGVYAWRPLLEKCNLEYRILYQTRHTFASIMIQQGEEIGWVSSTMGHKNIYVTLTIYAKFIKRKKQERATFLDDLDLDKG
ncbi:MAG: site-specific integrase [Epsilonproteobacteria bacterium]|nr:site-specific integrase [Campylobacterota bacterium]